MVLFLLNLCHFCTVENIQVISTSTTLHFRLLILNSLRVLKCLSTEMQCFAIACYVGGNVNFSLRDYDPGATCPSYGIFS